jgi:hypothetical protein
MLTAILSTARDAFHAPDADQVDHASIAAELNIKEGWVRRLFPDLAELRELTADPDIDRFAGNDDELREIIDFLRVLRPEAEGANSRHTSSAREVQA